MEAHVRRNSAFSLQSGSRAGWTQAVVRKADAKQPRSALLCRAEAVDGNPKVQNKLVDMLQLQITQEKVSQAI